MNRTRYCTVLWICNPTPYHPGHRPISIYNCTIEGIEPSFTTPAFNWSRTSLLVPIPSSGFEPIVLHQHTVHVKIEFVYLSDFSACASITEAAHLSLFIVVTRSLVPHIHFSPIKKPPSIATGGLLKTFDVSYIIRHNPPSSQNDTRGIL